MKCYILSFLFHLFIRFLTLYSSTPSTSYELVYFNKLKSLTMPLYQIGSIFCCRPFVCMGVAIATD